MKKSPGDILFARRSKSTPFVIEVIDKCGCKYIIDLTTGYIEGDIKECLSCKAVDKGIRA